MISNLKFIDLFAGIGGFRLALEALGHQCVFSSEIDEYSCEAYEKNFNERPFGDITKIPAEEIPEHDVICAGFPCQSFSIIGNRKGFDDKRGLLFYEITRIANHHKPKFIILENVPQIVSIDDGKIFEVIEQDILKSGYTLHWEILNSSDYGVPQSRKRWYAVAIRDDIEMTWNAPIKALNAPHRCVADCMLPEEEVKHLWKKNELVITHPNNLGVKANKIIRVGYIKRLDFVGDEYEHNVPQGRRVMSALGHATTQIASNGGSGPATGVYVNYEKNPHQARTLHNEEMKLVMGFPKSHIISENLQGRMQCGNAVIPKMIELVFNGIGDKPPSLLEWFD